MRGDDSIYDACPAIVRTALCDFLLPPYSSAEAEIAALKIDRDMMLRLLEKFADKIKELERKNNA